MGLTTIPEFLEKRFDGMLRTIVAMLLIISFVPTLLLIVLYTGALNIESLFELSDMLQISQSQGVCMADGFYSGYAWRYLCHIRWAEDGRLHRYD